MRYFNLSITAWLALAILPSAGWASGISGNYIVGQWGSPILSGCETDAVNRSALTCTSNASTAVYSIVNAPLSGGPLAKSVLTEGADLNPLPGDPTIVSSMVTFTGGTIPATHDTTPFVIGGISFTNGTSYDNTGIFGATLNLFASNGSSAQFIGSEVVQFNTTLNTGSPAQNADYLTFNGLAGLSFEVYEQATATGSLFGKVIGDPQVVLTGITLDPGQSASGFIGNDPALPLATPEPASAVLIGSGLLGLWGLRRPKRVARAALASLIALSGCFGAAISVNGICETGNCASPDSIALGSSATTSFNFTYTFANTDRYQIAGSFIGGNTGGPEYTIPFTAAYLGNTSGTSSSSDALTIDFLQNYQYTRASGTFNETLRGGFGGSLAPASAVQGQLFVAGQALPVQGPFSPPSDFSVTLGGQAVSGVGSPLLYDVRRVDMFGSGSGVGAAIINANPSTVPEPSSFGLLASGLGLAGLLILRRKRPA